MYIIIKRTSKILALIIVYMMLGYGYLTLKGFMLGNNISVVNNLAQAKEVTEPILSKDIKHIMGNKNAPLTLYMLSSMTCSHCRDYHKFILPKLKRDFIDNGNLNIIFVHIPLDATSMKAAKLSHCVGDEHFYDFIDELYSTRDWLFSSTDEALNKYAKKYNLTNEQIKECNDNKRLTSDILMTRDNAINNIGIEGTPSFILKSKNNIELIGPHKYNDIKERLEKLLEEINATTR